MKVVVYSILMLSLLRGSASAQGYEALSGSYAGRSFTGDLTYYVSNNVILTGATIIEGGAVFKFAANKSITVYDSIVFATTPYHPIIFTAKDDNSVGEPIADSTGTPTNYYATVALQLTLTNAAALSNLWFAHAHTAVACREDIDTPEVTNVLQNLRFVHCAQGLWVAGAADIAVEPPDDSFRGFPSEDDNLTNRLFLQNALFLQVNHAITGQTAIVVAENVTVDRAASVVSGNGAALTAFWPVVYCYNSVFAQVTNLTAGYASLYGGNNGFYRSPMFGAPTNGVSVFPFESNGWNDHFLTNTSPFVNDGDITATAAGLDAFTTQTSQTLDTTNVDLGWHYPVLLNLAAQCNTNGAGIALHGSLTQLINYTFVHGYEVYRRTTPGMFTLTDRIDLVAPPSAPSYDYVDFGALPGQTYYYAIRLLHPKFFGSGYVPLPYPATVSGTACCPVDNGTNLWVNYGYPAPQLAQWLMGTNLVSVQNAICTGAPQAIGIFGNGNGVGLDDHTFPFDRGVILASGSIANAIGPNDAWEKTTVFYNGVYNGDPDLDDLVDSSGTADAAILEFDIVATNAFTLRFEFVFASEEYPEYVGQFNDLMAIFVTTNRVGTNWIITANDNIAWVSETTDVPISVATINGNANAQYYVDNADPFNAAGVPAYNLQYDGLTTNLIAQVSITAGVTNHVKIAVADYSDAEFDSAVFLKAQVSPCP